MIFFYGSTPNTQPISHMTQQVSVLETPKFITSSVSCSFAGNYVYWGKFYIYYYKRHGNMLCTGSPGEPRSRFLVMSHAFHCGEILESSIATTACHASWPHGVAPRRSTRQLLR